jgi:hypothetical protein
VVATLDVAELSNRPVRATASFTTFATAPEETNEAVEVPATTPAEEIGALPRNMYDRPEARNHHAPNPITTIVNMIKNFFILYSFF